MTRMPIVIAVATVAVAGLGYALYHAGMRHGAAQSHVATNTPAAAAGTIGSTAGAPGATGSPAAAAGTTGSPAAGDRIDPKTGRRVLYWHDPMVPGHKFDKPGKSPFMDMQLVPVYADDAAPAGTIAIDPRLQQSLGIRTADVVRGRIDQPIEAVGTVGWNERDVAIVQARANGWIERLLVRAPLDPVKKGDALAELYVPDWVAAQEEFLTVRRMQLGERLVDGARQRMRLAGMNDEQIALVESTGAVQPRMRIVAPIGGVVTELAAREGMTVMTGATLFRLNAIGTVWVNADVPEALAASIRPGMQVTATTSAVPGRKFTGRIGAVLPELTVATRTLKARIEISNPGGLLVPGMFATISLSGASGGDRLLVPTEAVIRTGRRTIVMVAQGEGRFAPVDVEIGAEGNGRTEIRKGLSEGQKVVASGQFLVDSEASLKGVETRLQASPATSPATPPTAQSSPAGSPATTSQPVASSPTRGDVHRATGRVDSIAGNEVTLEHGPVPSLKWPSMTMGFRLPSGGVPKGIKPGDPIEFEFRQASDGQYEIVTMRKSADGARK